MKTVLVLGGYGFIGRPIVKQLKARGVNTLIGTRAKHKSLQLQDRHVLMHRMCHVSHWQEALVGVDVVVNSVGILRERPGESFTQVHHFAVDALVQACKAQNVRLVHISALGLDHPLQSKFANSKRAGEQAIMCSKADWRIIRASLVEGERGYGARWFRKMARWPVHFCPSDAKGLMCPVRVDRVARTCVHTVFTDDVATDNSQRVIELGGEQLFSVFAYLQHLRGKPPILRIRIPGIVSRIIAHMCDLLHVTPYSYGHYEILKYDNFPKAIAQKAVTESDSVLMAKQVLVER